MEEIKELVYIDVIAVKLFTAVNEAGQRDRYGSVCNP